MALDTGSSTWQDATTGCGADPLRDAGHRAWRRPTERRWAIERKRPHVGRRGILFSSFSAPYLTSTKRASLAVRLTLTFCSVRGAKQPRGSDSESDCWPYPSAPSPSDLLSNCFYYRSSKSACLCVLYGWLRAAGRLCVCEEEAS